MWRCCCQRRIVPPGRLVAHDADVLALSRRIYSRCPDTFVLIRQVEAQPERVIRPALTPFVTGLTPPSAEVGSPSLLLTVIGGNFAGDDQVLRNGVPLATQFVDAGKLQVQVDSALLTLGQTAGIAVRNLSPAERISPAFPFVVEQLDERVLLPLVSR